MRRGLRWLTVTGLALLFVALLMFSRRHQDDDGIVVSTPHSTADVIKAFAAYYSETLGMKYPRIVALSEPYPIWHFEIYDQHGEVLARGRYNERTLDVTEADSERESESPFAPEEPVRMWHTWGPRPISGDRLAFSRI